MRKSKRWSRRRILTGTSTSALMSFGTFSLNPELRWLVLYCLLPGPSTESWTATRPPLRYNSFNVYTANTKLCSTFLCNLSIRNMHDIANPTMWTSYLPFDWNSKSCWIIMAWKIKHYLHKLNSPTFSFASKWKELNSVKNWTIVEKLYAFITAPSFLNFFGGSK